MQAGEVYELLPLFILQRRTPLPEPDAGGIQGGRGMSETTNHPTLSDERRRELNELLDECRRSREAAMRRAEAVRSDMERFRAAFSMFLIRRPARGHLS